MPNDSIYDPTTTVGAQIARTSFDVSIEAAIKLCQSYVPALAAPVISQIFVFFVKKFMSVLYEAIEKEAAFLVIDIKVDRQSNRYISAVQGLKVALESNRSKEEVEHEKEKFKEALRNLISLKP